MTTMQKPSNRPVFSSTTDDTRPNRPITSTQSLSKTAASRAQSAQSAAAQRPQPKPISDKVKPRQSENPDLRKPASRHTLRVALATGTTVAALIGAQAIAIFGRTADAKPVIVGAHANDTDTAVPSSLPTQTEVPPSATKIAPSATAQPSATKTNTPLPSVTPQPSATALPSSTPLPRVYYTVKSGDTLGGIATRFKTTVKALMALNVGTLTNSNFVQIGQKLLISGPLSTTPTQTATPTDIPASPTETSTDSALFSTDATEVPTSTPWPTNTPIPTWTLVPIQVYRAPVQPAPRTKSS